MTLDVGDHIADHRPNAYPEELPDGTERLILRASAIGSCERALIAAANGVPPEPAPAWMQAKFDEGTIAEPQILSALSSGYREVKTRDGRPLHFGVNHLDPGTATSYRKLNENFLRPGHPEFGDGQFAMEWELWEDVWVRAHADSIASVYVSADPDIELGTVFGVEAKKFGEALWSEWIKKGLAEMKGGAYAWQVSAMMHASKLPFVFLVGQRVKLDETTDADEIEALGGATWKIGEVRAEVIYEPPVRLGDMKAKARRIAKGWHSGLTPNECEGKDFPCPMWKLCAESKGEKKEVVDLTGRAEEAKVRELEDLVESLRDAAEKLKHAETVKRRLNEQVMDLMAELVGEGKIALVGKYRVTHVKFDVPAQTIERKASTTSYPKIEERKDVKTEGES